MLIVSGGVSMGEFDLVEPVLAELGAEPLFDAVAIQPGKPMVAAVHPGGLLFALPGNPASAMVCFWLLVRPALRRLLGHRRRVLARGARRHGSAAPLPAARDRDRILPARVRFDAGSICWSSRSCRWARTTSPPTRAAPRWCERRAGSPARAAGEPCSVLPLANWANGDSASDSAS